MWTNAYGTNTNEIKFRVVANVDGLANNYIDFVIQITEENSFYETIHQTTDPGLDPDPEPGQIEYNYVLTFQIVVPYDDKNLVDSIKIRIMNIFGYYNVESYKNEGNYYYTFTLEFTETLNPDYYGYSGMEQSLMTEVEGLGSSWLNENFYFHQVE